MMTAARMVTGLLAAYAAGYSLVRFTWRGTPSGGSAWFRSAVSMLIGLGISSLTTTAYRAFVGALDRGFVLFDAVVLSATTMLLWRCSRGEAGARTRSPARWNREAFAAAVVIAVALLATIVVLVRSTRAAPNGGWDAWAIWNLRARFLFRSAGDWRVAFDPAMAWSHLDYPLLLPGSVARLWAYSGQETAAAPATVAAVFVLAGISLLGGALWDLRGPAAAAAGVLLLVATFGWHSEGRAQSADVPVACFLLAAMAVLEAARAEARRRRLALAGLLLALSAWTKNEGFVFLLVVPAIWGLFQIRARGFAAALAAVGVLVLAALPVVCVVLVLRRATGATNEFVGQEVASVVGKLTGLDRYPTIAGAFAKFWPGSAHSVNLAVLASVALLGVRLRALLSSWAIAAVAAVLASYFVAFAVTPYPLAWHLDSAAGRLLLQAWPSLLFALLLATERRDEASTEAVGCVTPRSG